MKAHFELLPPDPEKYCRPTLRLDTAGCRDEVSLWSKHFQKSDFPKWLIKAMSVLGAKVIWLPTDGGLTHWCNDDLIGGENNFYVEGFLRNWFHWKNHWLMFNKAMAFIRKMVPPGERLVVRGNQRTLRLSHLGFEVIVVTVIIMIMMVLRWFLLLSLSW